MTETTPFRRIAVALTIGSFSIAALMGIVALLGGGDFGDREVRVLLTTVIVGCASICVLCYLATAGTPWVAAGISGAVVLVVPVTTSLFLVWSDWDDFPGDGWLKSFGLGTVLAVTAAQICLLLALAGARHGLRLVLWATILLALIVAGIVSAMILGEVGASDMWRVLGVAAILDVLGTLVTIALSKFGRGDAGDRPVPASVSGLAISLPSDLAAALEQRSRETGRSPAHLVAEAVESYLGKTSTT